MPLDMWFRDDLRNILVSLNVASAAAARFSDENLVDAYRLGFQEALGSVAVALGMTPDAVGLRVVRPSTESTGGASPALWAGSEGR